MLHAPIDVRNALVGRLRPRSSLGRLQAKAECLCFFVILVTHRKSYIETTDRAISAANRQSGGEHEFYRTKFPNFVEWAESDKKTAVYAFLGYHSTILRTVYRKQFPQSNGTGEKLRL